MVYPWQNSKFGPIWCLVLFVKCFIGILLKTTSNFTILHYISANFFFFFFLHFTDFINGKSSVDVPLNHGVFN